MGDVKRSGFKSRGKGIERKARLKAKRDTPRRVAEHRERNDEYRRAVRELPCYMKALLLIGRRHFLALDPKIDLECSGGVDPDHQGKDRGAGLKSSDFDCVPMCRKHHDERQFMTGIFKNWDKAGMDDFCEEAVAWTRKRLGVVTSTDGRTSWAR